MALVHRLGGRSARILRPRAPPSRAWCAEATSRLDAPSPCVREDATAQQPSGLQLRRSIHLFPTSRSVHAGASICNSTLPMQMNRFASLVHPGQRRWSSSQSGDAYTEEQRKEDHRHCVEMVQTRDFEGYLCGLLMPLSAREAYFALRAFNVEIASIKDASLLVGGRSRGAPRAPPAGTDSAFTDEGGSTGDASLGSRLRMQWWRDSVAEIYEGADGGEGGDRRYRTPAGDVLRSLTSSRRHNPTLRSLAQAIRTHGLTHRFLRRILEAREADLDVAQYDALRDMAQYGEDTVSSVLYLSLETVGVREEAADVVASDVGVALGLLTALRSTGFRASQGESSIPADLASKCNVSLDTLWSESAEGVGASDALQTATREMADVAAFHLHRARDNQHAVPKEGRMCLLPAVCGLQYLDSLKGANYDVLHPSLVGGEDNAGAERRRRLELMFLLGRTWLTGTF